jgi:tight adherence protein C
MRHRGDEADDQLRYLKGQPDVFELIVGKLTSPSFLAMVFTAIAAGAAVLTVALPYLEKEELGQRMKDVALERDRIRARDRERLSKGNQQGGLRHQEQKAFIRQIVDDFKLDDWLGTEDAKLRLLMAGYRGQQSEYMFLFFRLVMPIAAFFAAVIYAFAIMEGDHGLLMKIGISISGAYAGIKAPEFFLSNMISKRQASVRAAFPDALDLTLICVESGMSTEQAFRKVALEIGMQSIPLAEELTLATAELSYLADRRQAYENLAARTGLDGVRAVSTALIQAERYGTPLGHALRVLSQEFREQRMNAAEKKAAALPPKLTVPMILFFLPVLFVVILGPAYIDYKMMAQ